MRKVVKMLLQQKLLVAAFKVQSLHSGVLLYVVWMFSVSQSSDPERKYTSSLLLSLVAPLVVVPETPFWLEQRREVREWFALFPTMQCVFCAKMCWFQWNGVLAVNEAKVAAGCRGCFLVPATISRPHWRGCNMFTVTWPNDPPHSGRRCRGLNWREELPRSRGQFWSFTEGNFI